MAKILYGIAKEGMGHAIRAKVIIKELSKKHKILILAGGRQASYLKHHFKNIQKIDDFDLVYRNNSINFTLTFFRNLLRITKIISSFNKAKSNINKFNPDIIISDFEPLSNHYSIISKKPLISLDNQHISTKCNITFPIKFKPDHIITSTVISSIITNAKYFLITSFIKPKTKQNNIFLFPPIIRKEIQNSTTKNKQHILVYQTSKSYKKLIPTLKQTKYKYIFYSDKKKNEKNIQFKKFSEKEFIKDLTECKAIITNGGFGLISEAIYLKKPILSIPVKKQFEQIFNALTIKKLGYGEFQEEISKDSINNFIKNLRKYKNNLKRNKNQDNSRLINKLQEIINKSC